MSKYERTSWRDGLMSERHRHYGDNCPAMDIDFLLIEYDEARPVALVEYKNQQANAWREDNPSRRAVSRLADSAGLPAFYVRYATNFSWFNVAALNELAKPYLEESPQLMTEVGWVEILYRLRGRTMPDDVREEVEGLDRSR